ncbi:MARCKS-related protein [Pyxicephalus adspersus]|uniref:Uncharacterized protein n=1 Tax=Pyxicephalus adspersus TaxID=30357 RepID=A0AAV3BAM9_PYXAD|nr:TPA: hypothetical protein GDO54_001203 [Pyxicephalus adspersus]
MGSIESKNQNAETATANKAAEQENGHVKTNGDAVQKPNGDAAAANGSAEPVPEEAGSGETIEQAPPANGDAKPEEPPGKQGKKKKFSFKKPFKLPFRKNKKEAAAAEESPATEEAPSPKEENVAPAEEPQTENVAEEASAPENTSTTPEEAPENQPEPAPTEQSEPQPSTEPTPEPPKEE